jgi:hypothetical protein
MRILVVLAPVLAAMTLAGPAAAQDPYTLSLQRDAELRSQADLARQRDIELNNRLSTLEARQQTDQALSDIAAMRQRPDLPGIYDPNAPPPRIGPLPPGTYVSIPDSILAESNARVRAAAANRR